MDQLFKAGDIVDYHSIIGGPATSFNHVIKDVGVLGGGQGVAWLENKSGCVSLLALTLHKEGE